MGIFHLDVRASAKTNVVLDVETEQRTGFAARLGDDEIVKGQVVGENQILFDVHHSGDVAVTHVSLYRALAVLQ